MALVIVQGKEIPVAESVARVRELIQHGDQIAVTPLPGAFGPAFIRITHIGAVLPLAGDENPTTQGGDQ